MTAERRGGARSAGSAALARAYTSPQLAQTLEECWPLHPIVACLLGPISRRRVWPKPTQSFRVPELLGAPGFPRLSPQCRRRRPLHARSSMGLPANQPGALHHGFARRPSLGLGSGCPGTMPGDGRRGTQPPVAQGRRPHRHVQGAFRADSQQRAPTMGTDGLHSARDRRRPCAADGLVAGRLPQIRRLLQRFRRQRLRHRKRRDQGVGVNWGRGLRQT